MKSGRFLRFWTLQIFRVERLLLHLLVGSPRHHLPPPLLLPRRPRRRLPLHPRPLLRPRPLQVHYSDLNDQLAPRLSFHPETLFE
jgi:hypothetical protein